MSLSSKRRDAASGDHPCIPSTQSGRQLSVLSELSQSGHLVLFVASLVSHSVPHLAPRWLASPLHDGHVPAGYQLCYGKKKGGTTVSAVDQCWRPRIVDIGRSKLIRGLDGVISSHAGSLVT